MFEIPAEATTNSLPHSREAEEAVIGTILIAPELFPMLGLAPAQFYLRRLGLIWTAYAHLDQKGRAIDCLTVSEELDNMGQLDEIGGPAYLTALLNQVPTTLHAEG